MKEVVKRFIMHEFKLVTTPLWHNDILFIKHYPNAKSKRSRKRIVRYASGVATLCMV